MESGELFWEKPWFSSPKRNIEYERPYKGINRILLADSKDTFYLTFTQIKKFNCSIKKGQEKKYWHILISKPIWKKDKKTNKFLKDEFDERILDHWMEKYYLIWGLSQIEGLDKKYIPDEPKFDNKSLSHIDKFINKKHPNIDYGANTACYLNEQDLILMPNKDKFFNYSSFYSTLLHELIHWTGNKKRNNRFDVFLNKEKYSQEELVAEIGSAVLLYEFGIKNEIKQNAAYIQSWLKYLKNNKEDIYYASKHAEKAIEFLKSN